MKVALINPCNVTAGFAMMTPRWMPVLAGSTSGHGVSELQLFDQAIEAVPCDNLANFDLIGISIHTLNAYRAYRLIRQFKQESRALIVVGGAHASLFPKEALAQGADAVVTGDADLAWSEVLNDARERKLRSIYDGGRVSGSAFIAAPRWDLMRCDRYAMATVHTTKGCPESCSFCSVWRTDGRLVRQRSHRDIVREVCELCARGFRFIVLADDNFYAVGAGNQQTEQRMLKDRYGLMHAFEHETPSDVIFLTQTSIRTAQDQAFLDAMRRAKVRLALVGIESVNSSSLRQIGKTFNKTGDELVAAVRTMQRNGVYVLALISSVFLPTLKIRMSKC